MSKRAFEAVKVFEASGGLWLPRASWRALRILARFYHEALGFAFAGVPEFADEIGMSERHFRRVVAELVELGLVRRHAVQRLADGSDGSSEYELPWYREVQASDALRSRIFKTPRARLPAQERLALPAKDESKLSPWMLFLARMRRKNAAWYNVTGQVVDHNAGDEGASPAGSSEPFDGDEGGCPAVAIGDEGANPADFWVHLLEENPVERARLCQGDGAEPSGEWGTGRQPVDLTKDYDVEKVNPYAPYRSGGGVWNRGKAAESREQHGRPTQSQKLACQCRGSRHSRCSPGRDRQPRIRDLEAHRQQLDGEDAALWDETTEVMRACGLSPEGSRKIRRAISEALRFTVHESAAGGEFGISTIHRAGCLARERWREYQELGELLFAPVGLLRFFAEGVWLRPKMWRCDRSKLEEMRRRVRAMEGSPRHGESVQRYLEAERLLDGR